MQQKIKQKNPKQINILRTDFYRGQVNPENPQRIRGATLEALKRFLDIKRANPRQPAGRKDTPFLPDGPIGEKVPGMWHAHLNSDISICYRVEGNTLYLYGMFSHEDLGTGASNRLKQKSMGQRFANMTFTEE